MNKTRRNKARKRRVEHSKPTCCCVHFLGQRCFVCDPDGLGLAPVRRELSLRIMC